MSNKNKNLWHDFYRALASFYDELFYYFDPETSILYRSQPEPVSGEVSINKTFRAVIQVGKDVDRIKELLDDAAKKFYVAAESDSRTKTKTPALPVYFPRFIDEDIFKIQIHENRAHSSQNYKQGDLVPVLSIGRSKLREKVTVYSGDTGVNKTYEQLIYEAVDAFKNAGYPADILADCHDSPYFMAGIDVSALCKRYQCDSIQRRFATGRQIRANFFIRENGLVQRSKLQTVGVVLTQAPTIEVVHSHERSIRTDAIYTSQHPDEININDLLKYDIHPDIISGRLYRKYDKE